MAGFIKVYTKEEFTQDIIEGYVSFRDLWTAAYYDNTKDLEEVGNICNKEGFLTTWSDDYNSPGVEIW